MHWLDDASLSGDGLTVTAVRVITPDHLFTHQGVLLPSALIELMAQAAAAGSGLSARSQNRTVRHGVLVAIRDFHVLASVSVGSRLTLTSIHQKSFGSLTQALLEARIDSLLVARAAMTFHLQFD